MTAPRIYGTIQVSEAVLLLCGRRRIGRRRGRWTRRSPTRSGAGAARGVEQRRRRTTSICRPAVSNATTTSKARHRRAASGRHRLDPSAAELQAELALYLRQNRVGSAIAGERIEGGARKCRSAPRPGTVYAALSEADTNGARGSADDAAPKRRESIDHLQKALAGPDGEADPNLRAALARIRPHFGVRQGHSHPPA
jgi:hypothetical protein